MELKTAGVLAAGLGGWSVAAVSDKTIVLGIRCQHNWVCMVHCSENKQGVKIDIMYGHPQSGLKPGITTIVPSQSDTTKKNLPVQLWAEIKRNVSSSITGDYCSLQWYPVLFAFSFYDLLQMAALYAFWPLKPKTTKTKLGIWRVSTAKQNVYVKSKLDKIYVNDEFVTVYSAQEWLGTASQDFTFFDLSKALQQHGRPAGIPNSAP